MVITESRAQAAQPPEHPDEMRPGHVIAVVIGTVFALLGLTLLSIGAALGWAAFSQRDGRFLTTPTERYVVSSYAITTEDMEVILDPELPSVVNGDLARIMLRGSSVQPDRALFLGIGPRTEVNQYLADVEHSELSNVEFSPFRASYRTIPGTGTPAPPVDQTFWLVSAQGRGTQQIDTQLSTGNWVAVVMNADGSRNVAADLQAGARSDLSGLVTFGILSGGLLLLAIGVPLVAAGAAGLGRSAGSTELQATAGEVVAAGPGGEAQRSTYPAYLRGELEPQLSRWLWLVKWLLLLPHFVVLAILWVAFAVVTVIAGFGILFTGRYPRSLFTFNVGVVRWTWRVGFYGYSALGTDRYPPFTLAKTDYPADFDVEYPERLSRGLVLVKWWLLAIPHYIILAAFSGAAAYVIRDADQTGTVERIDGVSLLGALVLIAAIALLFTGRYLHSIFDFVMGINRWIFRVLVYAALMRDEYPPFRLDQGAQERPAHPDVQVDRSASPPTEPGTRSR